MIAFFGCLDLQVLTASFMDWIGSDLFKVWMRAGFDNIHVFHKMGVRSTNVQKRNHQNIELCTLLTNLYEVYQFIWSLFTDQFIWVWSLYQKSQNWTFISLVISAMFTRATGYWSTAIWVIANKLSETGWSENAGRHQLVNPTIVLETWVVPCRFWKRVTRVATSGGSYSHST